MLQTLKTALKPERLVKLLILIAFYLPAMLVAKPSPIDPAMGPEIDPVDECKRLIATQQGHVSGSLEYKNSVGVCSYKGIPYAKPPIGGLRWRAPQSAEARKETLQAKSYADDCMQWEWLTDSLIKSSAAETSEDCLYLNIWRPAKPGKYPVMVWIHGGALVLGSGAWPIYQGTSFAARQDVIIVTINHRLGAFGYMAHPDLVDQNDAVNGGSAGNYGLMDQQKSLQWIQENIHQFSGDATNVTIFGESAGGWSVLTLLTSPQSEGLFHKAISQSGGSETTRDTRSAYKIGKRLAKKLKCKDGDIASCLRQVSAEKILDKSTGMSPRCFMSLKIGENFCFIPREDGTLLPSKPLNSMQSGAYLKIPVIAGYNSKDPWFLRGSTIDSVENMGGHPSYLYKYRYKKNIFNIFTSGIHGTELPFVFDTMKDFRIFHDWFAVHSDKSAKKAQYFVDQVQSYWANFAKTGNPNGLDINGKDLPYWPTFNETLAEEDNNDKKNYLYLMNKIKAKQR